MDGEEPERETPMEPMDAERQLLVDTLSAWIRENVGDERNQVELQLLNGVEADYRDDLVEPSVGRNGTVTLTIRINGGARHTQVQ